MNREQYISGLASEALERTTAASALSLREAKELASKGKGPFWTFRAEVEGENVIGGHTLIIEHADDAESAEGEGWVMWLEGGLFAEPYESEEEPYVPGDDLSEFEDLRFIPLSGEQPTGTALSHSLAILLGRSNGEIDEHL